jgi:hypothetical protein
MSLSFASNEVMGLITHDPLEESGIWDAAADVG